MKLSEIQPSQLFISSKRLSQITADSNHLVAENIEAIPIKKIRNEIIFTDGHTRALAAYLCRIPKVPVFWDEDELDWEAYQICVKWCKEKGVYTIADLKDRVVSPEEYEVFWLNRCKAIHQDLEAKGSHGKRPGK